MHILCIERSGKLSLIKISLGNDRSSARSMRSILSGRAFGVHPRKKALRLAALPTLTKGRRVFIRTCRGCLGGLDSLMHPNKAGFPTLISTTTGINLL